MNISISTYQIKNGDTLESVAEQLGISAEALKRYHNTYCDLKSLIEIDIKGVSEIMIPSPEKIKELQKNQQITLQQAVLPPHYLTKDFYASQYTVSERFITPSQDEDFTIEYKLGVRLKEDIKEGFVAEVRCSDHEKDNEKVDDKISSLSIACMESIYPLTFSVPVQGKIRQLHEPKNFLKKFESKRSDLEDFFVGEVAEAYLKKFHHILKSETYLAKQLTSTLVHQSLFPKMEWLRKATPWEEEFCLYPNSFFIKMEMETVHNNEDTEFLETALLGTPKEKYNLQELLRGIKFPEETEDVLDAELEIRYHTYKTSKKLYQVEAVVRLWDEEEELYYEHSIILTENKDASPKKKITTLVEE